MKRVLFIAIIFLCTITCSYSQTFSAYAALTLSVGKDTSVSPVSFPGNTTSISVSASGNFSGLLTARASNGIVTVTNAKPVGTYTITVKAFNSSGNSTTQTFSLDVINTECSEGKFFGNTTLPIIRPNLTGLAVGDFNGDGNQDLVAAHVGYNSIEVMLGNGSGGFGPTTEIGVASHPYAVVVGDFNKDGRQDLAIACEGANRIAIQLGLGNGTFGSVPNVTVGQSPLCIAIGDFNRDGIQDFVTANYIDFNLSVRLGDGTGAFTNMPSVAVGNYPESVDVGDFNNDGKQDLAVANRGSHTVSIRLGNGNGTFSAVPDVAVGFSPSSIAIADFNRDGFQDFAVSNHSSNTVSIRLGNGNGTFSGSTEVPVGNGPYSIALGNFDGDDFIDFVTTNYFGNTVSSRFGDGNGNFTGTSQFPVGSYPTCIVVGEFNNDNRQDLAIANYFDHTISVRYGMNGSAALNQIFSNSPVCAGQSIELFSDDGKAFLWSGPDGFSSNVRNPEIPVSTNASHGVYAVARTDKNNCVAITTTMVQVNPLPQVSFTLPQDSLCVYDSPVILSGGHPSGGVFSGTGVSAGVFSPSLAGAGHYYIRYIFTDTNDCSNTAIDKMNVLICEGLDEIDDVRSIPSYPNPWRDKFSIDLSGYNGDTEFNLLSTDGKLIHQWTEKNPGNKTYSFPELAPGLYVLKISNRNSIRFSRMFKIE